MQAAMAAQYTVPSVPKVHGQSPKRSNTYVSSSGTVGLVGPSSSDSALNKTITYTMSNARPGHEPKYATIHRGVRSEQLRRRSDAIVRRDNLLYATQPRRVSVPSSAGVRPRESVVMFHQQRSVVHSAATSKSPQRSAATSKSPQRSAAITKQPRATSVPNPCSNVDLPVLEELDYDNNNYEYAYTGYTFPNGQNGGGAFSLSENVKSMVQLLYIPFRCCKNKAEEPKRIRHKFRFYQFQQPRVCYYCKQQIWHLGSACTVCRYICHRKCELQVRNLSILLVSIPIYNKSAADNFNND